jgi:L-cystine uptake protein TcyP (sodium:dicarboxylate symporter family)
MINWIIMITPFAVLSLIIKAVGQQEDLKAMFSNVGWLIIATVIAMLAHYLVVHWALFSLSQGLTPGST